MIVKLGDQDYSASLNYNSNILVSSSFRNFSKQFESEGLNIKMVCGGGVEHYNVNKKYLPVATNQYLLSNSRISGYVDIKSENQVEGICVNLSYKLIEEVLKGKYGIVVEDENEIKAITLFKEKPIFNEVYTVQNSPLDKYLKNLATLRGSETLETSSYNQEIFYELASRFVDTHWPRIEQLERIPATRIEVKKDLLDRINEAKIYLDNHFRTDIHINQVAREVAISEYYFYRLFKSVFNISPHQYIINKRLALAYDLIQNEYLSVAEAADKVGFADIHSFSKSFKSSYGFKASLLKKSQQFTN